MRGEYPPNVIWNSLYGDYEDGYGNYRRDPLYSSYSFMPNANNQLHFKGRVMCEASTTNQLLIQIVNKNDGTVTNCNIPATAISDISFETAYYFDFYIGQLNPNHSYYIKFNTVVWNNGHQASFDVLFS